MKCRAAVGDLGSKGGTMASPDGALSRPSAAPGAVGTLGGILQLEKKLKDNTAVRVLHISFHISPEDEGGASIFAPRVPKLVRHMYNLWNVEIEDGNTYPWDEPLDEAQFRAYVLGYDAFLVVQTRSSGEVVNHLDDETADWEADLLGYFYVKPNFPGRCSHICNGGFLTAPEARGRGVGRCMAEAFLKVVPALGYKASMFNLVFANNAASANLWRSLGFREIGRVPKAGRLRSSPDLVDAIMFYHDFTQGQEAL